MQQANGTNTKKEKNVGPGLEKKTLQKTSFTSVLATATEILIKIEGKNPDKMCCDLSENIPTATKRMTQKFSIYLLGMSNDIYLNSYLKLHNTHLLHLFVDMYILKCF